MHHLLELISLALFEQNSAVAEERGEEEIHVWLLFEGCIQASRTTKTHIESKV